MSHFISLTVFLALLFAIPGKALPYVMPSSQILGLMARNFSSVNTLVVKQWVKVEGVGDNTDGALEELKVWIKAPWLYHCERTGSSEEKSDVRAEQECGWCNVAKFQCMFLNHSVPEMIGFLSRLGVQTSETSLTHLGAQVAYLIGKRRMGESYIVISREKFLPLLIHIGVVGSPMGPFNVSFDEYRKTGNGFYPYRILCEPEHAPVEEYVAQDVVTNVSIDPSIFRPAPKQTNLPAVQGHEGTPEDE